VNLFDSVRYFFTTRLSHSTFRFHRFVLEHTGGKLLPTSGRMPVFLLTTTGRNSGQPRTQPLSYLQDGDCYVVIASNAGQSHDPAWYLNLAANPEATIRIGGRSIRIHAETAGPTDQARLWALAKATDPLYAAYEMRTDRSIPIVFLTPVDHLG
jgi:F420H(2)-dependent quinone reductase